jgi:hypothetical protein
MEKKGIGPVESPEWTETADFGGVMVDGIFRSMVSFGCFGDKFGLPVIDSRTFWKRVISYLSNVSTQDTRRTLQVFARAK